MSAAGRRTRSATEAETAGGKRKAVSSALCSLSLSDLCKPTHQEDEPTIVRIDALAKQEHTLSKAPEARQRRTELGPICQDYLGRIRKPSEEHKPQKSAEEEHLAK